MRLWAMMFKGIAHTSKFIASGCVDSWTEACLYVASWSWKDTPQTKGVLKRPCLQRQISLFACIPQWFSQIKNCSVPGVPPSTSPFLPCLHGILRRSFEDALHGSLETLVEGTGWCWVIPRTGPCLPKNFFGSYHIAFFWAICSLCSYI